MKRVFEIEWDDDYGPLWMNTTNLLICLTEVCINSKFTVRDVTGDGVAREEPETMGPIGQPRWSKVGRLDQGEVQNHEVARG